MTSDGILATVGGVIASLLGLLLGGLKMRVDKIEKCTVSTKTCDERHKSLDKLRVISDERLLRMEAKIDRLTETTAKIAQAISNGVCDVRRQ